MRKIKQREAKPFALMVPGRETVEQLCHVNPAETESLRSRRCPIVLLDKRRPARLSMKLLRDPVRWD